MARPTLAVVNRNADTNERIALRTKIAEHAAQKGDISNLQGAVEKATREYWAAVGARNSAREALEAAPDKYAEYLAEKACGRDIEKPMSVKEAEAALAEAEDTVKTASKVKELLEGKLTHASAPHRHDVSKIREAALAVIRSETPAGTVFDEIIALQRQLVSKRLALRWLTINRIVPSTDSSQPGYDPDGARNPDRDDRLPGTRRQNSEGPEWWTEVPGDQPFEAALRALMEDAGATVPKV